MPIPIINNLILHREDVVVLDMEAGLEHLGRGTTEGMDQFIVVIEPGARSVQTYKNVKRLAEELGVKEVKVIANKIRNDEDEKFVRSRIPKQDFLGCYPKSQAYRRSICANGYGGWY